MYKKFRTLFWLLPIAALVLSSCSGLGGGPKLTIHSVIVAQIGETEVELKTLSTEEITVSKVENEDTGAVTWVVDSAKLEKEVSDAEAAVIAMNSQYNVINGISHPMVVLESDALSDLIKAKGVVSTKSKFDGKEITIVYRVESGDQLKFNGIIGERISFSVNIADGEFSGDFSQTISSYVSFLQSNKLPDAKIRVAMMSGLYDPNVRVLEAGHIATLTVKDTNNGPICDVANIMLAFIAQQNGGAIVRNVYVTGSTMTISMWVDLIPATATPTASPFPTSTFVPTATPVPLTAP